MGSRTSATFEYAGANVLVAYRGERRWTVDAGVFDNGTAGRAIADALALTESAPYGTRIAIHADGLRHGVIARNTVPATAWWYDIDPGAAGVCDVLPMAFWGALEALELAPSRESPVRAPFADPQFSYAALEAAADIGAWATALARAGEAWLGPDSRVEDAIAWMEQLRALGHPLYNYDESTNWIHWATWGPERPPRELFIEIARPVYERAVVTVTTRPRA